jgi:hypothetical protein
MEEIRFEFSMELRRRKSKKRRRCRMEASTKISRKAIPENRSHMKERPINDFKT